MDISYVITAVVGAFTGIVGSIVTVRQQNKKSSQDDFKLLKESYVSQFESMEKKIEQIQAGEELCNEKNRNLDSRFQKLTAQFRLFQIARPNLEAPAWMKDSAGVMLALNDEYEKKVSITTRVY